MCLVEEGPMIYLNWVLDHWTEIVAAAGIAVAAIRAILALGWVPKAAVKTLRRLSLHVD